MNEIIVFCVYRNTTGNRKITVTGLSNKSVQVRLKRTASISFQFKNVETNVFMFAINASKNQGQVKWFSDSKIYSTVRPDNGAQVITK